MIWNIVQTGRFAFASLTGTTNVTDESIEDVIDSAAQATNDAAKEVNQFVQFFEDHIPNIIAFGIDVLLALVAFFVGGRIIRWIRKLVRRSFDRTHADAGVAQFIDSMLKFGLYALLIFIIATNFGIESSSIAALIASAGVAVGLALQGSLSNFAGGILILLLKPFAVGDYIIVTQENIEGTVKEIQIFYTKLATVDNQTVVVPNSILTNNSLTNVTARPERQLDLKVGIAYDSDLKKAKSLIEDMLTNDPCVIQDEEIKVFVAALAESAVMIGLRAWVKTEEYWAVRWRLLEQIKTTFDAEQIEIPYNQLTVNLKTEEDVKTDKKTVEI
ncbi:MAG TPA: mechanosensitive ion channel [Candidatus Mediterraneibacter pullistercoris]|nr:mechanosensitive ion channel [Candidatus Mediterraneibacter pullistercoris]